MNLDELQLGRLLRVFEADRIALFERGELHAVDEFGDIVRQSPTWFRTWDVQTGKWRDGWTVGVVYLAPATRWRQLVLEAERLRGAAGGDETTDSVMDAPPPAPVKGWAAVAGVLGVSTWTLRRRRAARGDERHPYFDSDEHVRAWWAGLVAGPPPKATPARRGGRRKDAVADDDFTLANLEAGKLPRRP